MNANEDRLRELVGGEAAEHYVAQHDDDAMLAAENDLLAWLRRSPAHVAEYLRVARLARDVANAAKRIDIPLDRLIEEARKADNVVDLSRAQSRSARPSSPKGRGLPWRWAAAGALAVGFAVVAVIWSRAPKDYATLHGDQQTWRLDDGTVLHLDSDSGIRVTLDRRQRLVELDHGQAFFEVAKDPNRPFRVVVGNAILQDVGTSFDVFRKNSGTIVTVTNGQVAIWNSEQLAATSTSSPRPLAELHAGQQATVSPTGAIKVETGMNVRRATAWLRQEIVFDQDRIADVAAEFNRYNDTQINVTDPRIAGIAITGMFHTYDLDSFVQFLNGLPDIEAVRQESPAVVIVRSRPRPLRR